MKKFIALAIAVVALTIFNGCQKEELVLTDEQPQAEVKPDVYVESGYLVLKDLNVVDSVMKSLKNMNQEQVLAWEKQLGFESARTHYDKILIGSEKINTVEEIISFREKYKDVFKWNETDTTDFSFDYPFYHTNLLPLMNKDGLLKIGKSLFKYNKENRITIFDGDISKLKEAMKLDRNTDNVFILGKKGDLKAHSISLLTNFVEDYGSARMGDYIRWSSDKRMKNELKYEVFTYTTVNGTWEGGYQYYLVQQAQDRTLGVWWNYYTSYRVQNIVYKVNGNTVFYDPNAYTTGNIKPDFSYYIYSAITVYSITEPPLSSISRSYPIYISCPSTNKDFSNYYPIFIDYTD